MADTERLVADGIINSDQAKVMHARSRATMVNLAINSVLCFGIIAATCGLVLWLANALSVTITGVVLLGGDCGILCA